MTKATRIINKYHIKEILLNGDPQFENFYKEELIQFCEVARELLKQNQKYKEVIDKLNKKCNPNKVSYDYGVWLKLNDSWKTLDDFAENIKYNLHQIITYAYQCDIKNSIKEIIEVTKREVVLKEDILDILKEVE